MSSVYGRMLPDGEIAHRIEDFINTHTGKKFALITSGGTRVPLEKNAVRFIDNFSMGTRGAASAEYFLSSGYAVIFVHREESLLPYSRHYPHIFSRLRVDGDRVICDAPGILTAVQNSAKYASNILFLPFVTLEQYLHLLEKSSIAVSRLNAHVLLYLAAAVSDFYVTHEKMPTHKIQSSDGGLNLALSLVPKTLDKLVNNLVPHAFVISFKLETDESILIKKARGAIEKYGHELVIGNILETRKHHVVFVDAKETKDINLSTEQQAAGVEIEQLIVEQLSILHDLFITHHKN